MFGMEATNEDGWAYLYANTTVQSLPAPVRGSAAGDQEGEYLRPRHAFMTIEGGDIRYRLDGSDPVEPFGVLAKDGESIDWTDPLRDFSAFIANMRVIAVDSESVLINISWRS